MWRTCSVFAELIPQLFQRIHWMTSWNTLDKSELVLRGWLMKEGAVHKTWRRRWFCNSSRDLYKLKYYSDSLCSEKSCKGVIDLESVAAWHTFPGKQPGEKMVTGIVFKTGSRVWRLVAEGPTASDYWTRGLKHIMEKLRPSSPVAPSHSSSNKSSHSTPSEAAVSSPKSTSSAKPPAPAPASASASTKPPSSPSKKPKHHHQHHRPHHSTKPTPPQPHSPSPVSQKVSSPKESRPKHTRSSSESESSKSGSSQSGNSSSSSSAGKKVSRARSPLATSQVTAVQTPISITTAKTTVITTQNASSTPESTTSATGKPASPVGTTTSLSPLTSKATSPTSTEREHPSLPLTIPAPDSAVSPTLDKSARPGIPVEFLMAFSGSTADSNTESTAENTPNHSSATSSSSDQQDYSQAFPSMNFSSLTPSWTTTEVPPQASDFAISSLSDLLGKPANL
ncbi:hypothetical protein Pelo_9765 [Pelomyxa schiedti]|nr:hypothetical protein Pelo_9765 [Pelomyxa schiedti]